MKYMMISKEDSVSLELQKRILAEVKHTYSEVDPEIVIAIGGDGTILKAVHSYPNAIIFGLHTGHLGFFSNYSVEDFDVLISDINNGEYRIDFLDQLICQIETKQKNIIDFALNEMTIMMPPRTLILDVSIDDKELERFRGTGFCISTPFGSTAYNKSLHGAVVDPLFKSIQLTEIAGINSNAYRTLSSPLILSHKRKISLKAVEAQPVFITIDSISYQLEDFIKAEICYADHNVKMAYHDHPHFIHRIKRSFLKE